MIDVWNKVIYNLRIAGAQGREGVDGKVRGKFFKVTSTPNANESVFPTIGCEVINSPEAANDLEYGENGARPIIRLQAFHNTTFDDCRDVMTTACDAMNKMGFRRTFLQPIPNEVDRKIFRMEGRFTRFVGSIDDIPDFSDLDDD